MKKIYLLLCSLALGAGSAYAQVTVTGSTGADNTYTTLGAAFTAINAAAQTGNNINIAITANTTEAATGATLNAGTWTTMTIAPSGGSWTVSGAATAGNPLINFNGADNVTINGGDNLTFSNTTASATSGTSTLKLIADATNNTFNNVKFLTAATMANGTNGGAVWISTGTTTGNDNNSFQACKFSGNGTGTILLYANGSITTAAIANSNITVNNCEFYDYFGAAVGSSAIYASAGNTVWSITNNKIYQTAPRTLTAASTVYGIYFVSATYGENLTITGNTIGYASNAGTGTMSYASGANAGGFYGINLSLMTTATTTTNVNSNIIANIQWTSTTTSVFYGIYNVQNSTTATNPININNNTIQNIATITTTGQNTAIYAGGTNTLNCNNNTVTNMSRSGAGALFGINWGSSNVVTLNNNTVTNLSSTSTTSTSNFFGMYSGSSPLTENITNNTINNLTSSTTATQSLRGIYLLTFSGTKTVQNNTVSNLSQANSSGIINGIAVTYGTTHVISDNKVNSLSGAATVIGLNLSSSTGGATGSTYKNNINGIVATNQAIGMQFSTGYTTQTITNNFITNITAPTANSNNAVLGIDIIPTGTATYNVFNNTIYPSSGGALTSSGALFGGVGIKLSTTNTITQNVKNNIIKVMGTKNGDAYFAAVKMTSAGTANTKPTYINLANNIYFSNNIYGEGLALATAVNVFGANGTSDPYFNDVTSTNGATCSPYKTFNTADKDSYIEDNLVAGTAANTYAPSASSYADNSSVTTSPAVTEDYQGTYRAATYDRGALEFSGTTPIACDNTTTAGTISSSVAATCANTNFTLTASGYTSGKTGISYQWASSTTSGGPYTDISGANSTTLTTSTTATTYYIFKVVCGSCGVGTSYASTELAVSVNPLPTVAVTPSSAAYCTGSTNGVNLTASGAATYTWTPITSLFTDAPGTTAYVANANASTVYAKPTVATTYTVKGTDANGCFATATAAISLSNSPSLSSVTATPNTLCSGGSSSLTAVSASATYTAPPAVSNPTTDEDLGNITISQGATTILNNTTPINSLVGTIGTATGTAGSYSNFTAFGPYNLVGSQTYNFSASTLQGTSAYGNAIAIYIDYNRNGVFTDAGEAVYVSAATTSGAHTETGTFTVPATALNGSTRMRIVVNEGLVTGPTMAVSWGEYEEYSINITGATDPFTYSWSDGASVVGTTNPLTVSPTAASTTYTATVTNAVGCSTTGTVTVTQATPIAVTVNSPTRCSAAAATAITATPSGGGSNITYTWSPTTNLYTDAAATTAYTGNALTSATIYTKATASTSYTVTVADACTQTANATATVTVNATPVATASSNSPICAGSTINLTGSADVAGTTFAWTGPNSFASTNQNPSITSATSAASGTYSLIANANGCASSAATTSVVVNGAPSSVSISPASPTVNCGGNAVQLTASGGTVGSDLTQTFETFPVTNFSTSAVGTGTPTATQNTTYYSQGSSAVLFNTASTGANVAYSLNQNVDLSSSPSAQLKFSHIAAFEGSTNSWDIGYVEYSADGGATWTTFPSSSYAGSGTLITTQGTSVTVSGVIFSAKSYTDWTSTFTSTTATPGTGPGTALWKNETINIPSAALTSQFRIRFRYTTDVSSNYYGWLIDNIQILGSAPTPITWSPTTNLYTDAAATTAYTGTAVTSVYAKPSAATVYTAVATSAAGCTNTNTTNTDTVKVNGVAQNAALLSTVSTVTLNQVSCEENGWTYYADPSDASKYMFGIKWGSSNATAKAAAQINLILDAADGSSTQTTPAVEGTWTMKRRWNVSIGGAHGTTLAAPVDVRFFYNAAEKTAIETAASNFATTNGGTTETPTWFKTVNAAFDPTTQLSPQMVTASNIPLTDANATGQNTMNGVLYAEFQGITSFSGGTYATGVGTGTPLPTSIRDIFAANMGDYNKVTWISGKENELKNYTVQRSQNGTDFSSIANVEKLGENHSYSYFDRAPYSGINYYRLLLNNNDGSFDYSKVVTAIVKGNGFKVSAVPNPAYDKVTISVIGKSGDIANLSITDALGRTMKKIAMKDAKVELLLNGLAPGMYFINYVDDNNTQTIKLEVR